MLQRHNSQRERSEINESHYHFIYIFRKSIPNSQLFYIVILIIKFLSMIDFTSNVSELESEVKGIHYIITQLYLNCHIKFQMSTYKWLSLVILIALIAFIAFSIYTKQRIEAFYKSLSSSIYVINGKSKPKYAITIISYIVTIISIGSQHLIEILFLGIYIQYSKGFVSVNSIFKYTSSEADTLDREITTCCVANTISIAIIELIAIVFYHFASANSFQSTNGFNSAFDTLYYSLLILISASQGLAATSRYMEQEAQRKQFKIFICFIITGYNLACVLIAYKQFVYSGIDYLLQFLHLFIFISGTTEIFTYYFYTQLFSLKLCYLKLIIQLVNSLLILSLVTRYKYKTHLNEFALNVFSENKHFSHKSLFAYIHLLNTALKTRKDLFRLYELFIIHSEHCTISSCPCRKVRPMPSAILIAKQSKVIERFIIVAEQEIVKEIIKKSKTKLTSIIQTLIFLHLDLVSSIKNSKYLALYLSQSYLSDSRFAHHSFKTKYLVFEYKKEINARSIFPHKCHNKFTKKSEVNQSRTARLYMKSNQLKKYILFIEKIKHDLLETCESLASFFFLKNTELKLIGGTSSKCKEFVSYIETFDEKDKLLLIELRHAFAKENRLKNKELCYLLLNYYLLVYKALPKEIDDIIDKENVSYLHLLKDNIDFDELKQSNPMIVSIDNKDVFSIKYISQRLCNAISYQKSKIINEDFKVLLPTLTGKIHSLYMKQFSLSGVNHIKKSVFYIDKEERMIPIRIKVNIFPNLSGVLSLIINSTLIQCGHDKQAEYHFLLDQYFNVLATNAAFEEYFFFNNKMLSLFRVSFCNFFSLSCDKLYDQFREAVNSHLHQHKHNSQKKNIEELNQAISIMSICSIDNMFSCRKKKALEVIPSNFKPLHVITKYITHLDIFNSINQIEKEVEELGFDTELSSRVVFLKERLRICLENQKQSSNSDDNALVITIKLKMISNLIYYTAVVNERIYHIEKIKEHSNAFEKRKSSLFEVEQRHPNLKEENELQYQNMNANSNSKNKEIRQKTYLSRGSSSIRKGNNIPSNTIASKQTDRFINLIETSSSLLNTNSNIKFINHNQSDIAFKSIDTKMHKDYIIEPTSFSIQPIPISNLNENYTNAKSTTKNKRNQCGSKLLSALNWILTLFILFFIVLSCIILITLTNKLKNLFTIYAYSTMANGDLSFCSLNIITNCLIADRLYPPMSISIDWLLHHQNDEMKNTSYIVKKYLSQMATDTQTIPVLNTIHEEIVLKYIYEDYQIKERVSSVWDELFYLYYLINKQMIQEANDECRVKSLFFNERFASNSHNPIATNKEHLLFYVLYNIMPILRIKMFQITNMSLKEVLDYNKFVLLFLQFLNVAIICLMAFLYTIFFIQLCMYKNRLKNYLNCLLNQRPGENDFEDELKCYINIINDFDSKTVTQFETYRMRKYMYKPLKNSLISLKESLPSQLSSSSELALASASSAQASSLYSSLKLSHKKTQYGKEPNKAINNNTTNNSALNASNDIKETNNQKAFEHYFVSSAIIITIVIGTVNFIIQLTDLFMTYQSFLQLKSQSEIGSYLIQRIPTLVDLALYFLTSTIINNSTYIKQDDNSFYSNSLWNLHSKGSKETNYTQMSSLNSPYYAQLNFNLQIQRESILNFIKSNNKNIFVAVMELEQSFNDPKEFIFSLSVENTSKVYEYDADEINKDTELIIFLSNLFKEINDYAKAIKNQGNKINSNGLNAVIDLMVHEFNIGFISFFSVENKEIRNQTQFIGDKDIIDLIQNIQITFNGMYHISSHMILADMFLMYDKTKTTELWMFMLSLVLHLLFSLVIISGLLLKLQKTESLLSKTKRLILNAIKSPNCISEK